MAIGDILEGLFGGAAGGLRRYSAYQEEEVARREREAEREAARLERQEALKMQQAQADRLFNMEVQRAVAEGILAPTEYVKYAEPSDFLRGEPIGMQRLAAGADMSSILAGQPIGMQRQASNRRSEIASVLSPETRGGRMAGGATVAPNQTYSAIDRVLALAEPTPRPEDIGARYTKRPARGLDRVLEITPEDIAGRFKRGPRQGSWTGGRGTFEGLDGQMYRATTPEERASMARELEQDELERQARNVIAAARLRGLDLTLEQGRAVASGAVRFDDLISPEPKTIEPTNLQQDLRFLMDQGYSLSEALDRLEPLPEGRAGGVEGLSPTDVRTIYNQAQRRLASEIAARAETKYSDDLPQYTPEEARERLREIIEEETETFLSIGLPRKQEEPPVQKLLPASGSLLEWPWDRPGNFPRLSAVTQQPAAIDTAQAQAGAEYLERFQQELRDKQNRTRR